VPPVKGKCPFKEGVIRKSVHGSGVILGTEECTVDVWGKDSMVLSATNGRVMDVMRLYALYITIRTDTTNYTYIEIDRPLVKEGEMVKAGQVIGIAKDKRISFFVSNYLNKIFCDPCAYVDCSCELAEQKSPL
jgi:hypothetical protein